MTINRHQGFTLLEIMIALAISAFLLAGIIQVFVSLKYTDGISTSISRVQEAGRIGLNIIANDLRMAGYRGCIEPGTKNHIAVKAKNAPTSTNSFSADILRGFEVTATGWSEDDPYFTKIDDLGKENARINSDVLSVMHASSQSVPVVNHTSANAPITISANSMNIESGQLVGVTSCKVGKTDIFRVTSADVVGGNTQLGHASTENEDDDLSATYDDSANLMFFYNNAYFVGDTGRQNSRGDAIYALYRLDVDDNIQEIVEGVENLQVTYGQVLDNGNIRFVPADDSNLDVNDVTSVKISLLVASTDAALDYDDTIHYSLGDTTIQPASSGGVLTYPNDRRLRKVFSSTINLRNKILEDQ